MFEINKLTLLAINASIDGGKRIMEIYNNDDFGIQFKKDQSPLTKADIASNNTIKNQLQQSNIPLLSEEGKEILYSERTQWQRFWLVDPLDGTKEFIKRNGEFTVNIALIENQYPIIGVVYVPYTGDLYFANKEIGSYKLILQKNPDEFNKLDDILIISQKLPIVNELNKYTVVGSRSHMSEETMDFIETIKKKHGNIEMVSRGSALKLCLVAEGKADIYPRFGPTMEWDTGAGHAVIKFSGANIFQIDNRAELKYNKKNLLNPYFIAERIK